MATDEFTNYYTDLLDGSYDCVDRFVLNANFGLCYSPGGFRSWWRRLHHGSDAELDNAHLMRMAGRFSRRVRGWAQAHGVPVIDCGREERKHLIAEEHLKKNPCIRGLFLILVGRAVATVWDVKRSSSGVIQNLEAKRPFINHYSFHIMDPDWGHVTIKMAGHPPFGAQIILNGHEYVACQAREAGIPFTKEGNCFTVLPNLADLARVADTLSEVRTIGRLSQVCERWIYSACLCFALDLEEQERSGFHYHYSIYQVECSRNLIFQRGSQMEQIFQGLIDRTRARLTVKRLKTIFGVKCRPHRDRKDKAPRLEVVVETPAYDLTIFKLHFGKLTLKVYTKGERVLRFEAIVHNTKELRCGRLLERFPQIIARLQQILEQFLNNLYCMDASFISGETLDQLATPSQVGKTRIGGMDVNKPRTRAVLSAVLALACSPDGFTTGQLANTVRSMLPATDSSYDPRRAAYDLRKLRGKELVSKVPDSRRYFIPQQAVRTIAALVILREKILRPILAGVGKPKMGRKPKNWSSIDEHYEAVRQDMFTLMEDLRIAA
ncbi:MAG TPA: hypothetical protein VJ723_08940 [Candidatus Angelobacter sp.]|jgi:hypothetical protein|nr:hypothetical protein [Candidatus Angelobacter sp.]